MKEDLLHLVWKLKRFHLENLKTTLGQSIRLIKFGHHNKNAGPDFLNGEIIIDDTKWLGHIEMHLKSSDWDRHKHQFDPAYNNVILHVVYHHDKEIKNLNQQKIPTLVLDGRINQKTINEYSQLSSNLSWIPCQNHLNERALSSWSIYKERILVERLEQKCSRIVEKLDATQNDWEEILYSLILKYLGLKVNGEAFEQLAYHAPHQLIRKLSHRVDLIEALLFGQANMIKKGDDEYMNSLKNQYRHLKTKYSLTSMTGVEWRFARMRPANFPTIRISQIANLYHKTPQLFNSIKNKPVLDHIYGLLDVCTSPYWDTHFIPAKKSVDKKKAMGIQTKNLVIINAIVPLLFSYGIKTQNEKTKENALDLLRSIKAESNNIIKKWTSLGLSSKTAFDSQAIIQLKTQYCDRFKCLDCQIGLSILFE